MMISSSSSSRCFQAAFAACLLWMGCVCFSSVSLASGGDFSMTSPMVGTANDYQANVESRLSALERQLRDVTGKLERAEFENTQLKTRLDKALSDIEIRFQDMQPSTPTASAETADGIEKQSGTLAPDDMGGAVEMPPAKTVTQSSDTPADINAPASSESESVKNLGELKKSGKDDSDAAGRYESAFAQLKSGNFSSARKGFESFLADFPDHPLSANATYWMGESYYADGQYEKAARIFAESYKKYPKGPKVADSLLKMGMSLGGSGKTKEACVSLAQLKKQFGNEEGVTLRRADQEMKKLGCQ